jgi:hypothetical protein
MRSFTKYSFYEMDGVCSTYMKCEEYIMQFCGNFEGRDCLESPNVVKDQY